MCMLRDPGRRAGLVVLGALVVGGGCSPSQFRNYAYFGPDRLKAGLVREFPTGRPTLLQDAGLFVFRTARGFHVLEAVCTHGESVLYWNEAQQQAKCVRHGCIFDRNGRAVQGPAVKPLRFFYCLVDDGALWVDRSREVEPSFVAAPRPHGTPRSRTQNDPPGESPGPRPAGRR